MTALLLVAAALLAEAPAPEVTPTFDPFVIVGVCPVKSGPRPWSVVFHQFGDDMPEDAQIASGRVFKHLGGGIDDCLARMIESDLAAREAAYALESASDPDTLLRLDRAVRAVWSKHGVDTAVREIAATGRPGPATEKLLALCEKLTIQDGR